MVGQSKTMVKVKASKKLTRGKTGKILCGGYDARDDVLPRCHGHRSARIGERYSNRAVRCLLWAVRRRGAAARAVSQRQILQKEKTSRRRCFAHTRDGQHAPK
jgi:hypothetical protein